MEDDHLGVGFPRNEGKDYSVLLSLDRNLLDRISRLEAALKEIAEHPHCNYHAEGFCKDIDVDSKQERVLYELGCSDGHKCAAEISRKALEQP